MSSSRTIRVLLVDEHELVLSSLSLMLESIVEIEVVGQAANGTIAVQMVADLQPDVVMMDLNMPVMDGLTATQIIREKHPQTKVIILTASILEGDFQTAAQVGANGYLRKDCTNAEIVAAIRSVVQ
jgi:DNA-binding NarL/FixJ family response regulator